MGFIKGGLLIFVSILLLVSFLAGNAFLTLTLSLEYENVQPELVSVAGDLVQGEFNLLEEEINLTEEVEANLGVMEEYCQNNSEYVFSEQGYTFVVPCDVVGEGTEAILGKGLENIVEKSYYQDYDCGFWDCLKTESPLFLISERAHDYWQQKFYITLIFSILLIILAFFFVEHKQNFPIVIGSLLLISSLPFMKLEPLFSFLDDTMLYFLTIFISKAHTVFWISLILGFIILGTGILLHFVNLGNFIAEKLEKYKKKSSSVKGKESLKKEKE